MLLNWRLKGWGHLLALGCALTLALWLVPAAFAQGPGGTPAPADNAACLSCHSNLNLSIKLSGGEILPLYVDAQHYTTSVHGQQQQACTTCHANITSYPHPALTATTVRDLTVQLNASCTTCHAKEAQLQQDSIHAQVMAAGNRNAPVCTDCHTAHATQKPDSPRTLIPQTCDKCHSAIYDQYKSSVHGAALVANGNPDVPTCVDCHGVHNIPDPTTNAFRLKSPQLCASCHTNAAMMQKYNLSTHVLSTYVADFHGTTVELFAKQSPDAPTNKPVCLDCHGVHDIRATNDPQSTVFQQNLLKTCQQCHPNATANFPAAWLNHYDATPTRYPLIWYVNLFYTILIPLVIGGMVLFVLLDVRRRWIQRRQTRGGHAE